MSPSRKLAVATLTLVLTYAMYSGFVRIAGLTERQLAMLGITILAIVYWVTECVPIPVTGLVIILLEVVYGVFPFTRAISYIASEVNILILAGLVIAVSLSKYQLDRIIALRILRAMGSRSDLVILGMMLATSFLSMWVPNTAAAAIMVPVAAGMLELIRAEKGRSNVGKAAMIGIAYAASIGGIGTPIGTPPVPITIRNVMDFTGYGITFAQWMAWGVPLALVLTVVAWRLLILFFPPEVANVVSGRRVIEEELGRLGKLDYLQRRTLILFGAAVTLWLLDSILPPIPMWTYVASLIIITLYLFPWLGTLSWDDVSKRVDWGVIFLVAGGLALGGGLREVGLVDLVAEGIATQLKGASPLVVSVSIALLAGSAVTVFCSITATSSALVPVAIGIAQALGLDARYIGIVAGVASCYAFLFPANTPPNAIAYSYGYFKNYEMAKVGVVLLLVGSLILIAFMPYMQLLLGSAK